MNRTSYRDQDRISANFCAVSILVVVLLVALIPGAFAGANRDIVTLGSVESDLEPGVVVRIPIYLTDRSGSLLDAGSGLGFTIQGLSATIEPDQPGLVSSMSVVAAGATVAATAVFNEPATSGNRVSRIAFYDEASDPLVLTLDASSPGDRVATLEVVPSALATALDTLTFTLVPETTALANGTGVLVETVSNGQLVLVGGQIVGTGIFVDGFESGGTTAWSQTIP